ncbi:MAG: cell wall hydrolase [Butyrivibrio sp.]|nr:cell wall hydrolase [Butyrivibrio sp.]
MSGINSKLSGVIAGAILVLGVITDAFTYRADNKGAADEPADGKEIVQDMYESDEIAEVETDKIHSLYGVTHLKVEGTEAVSEQDTEALTSEGSSEKQSSEETKAAEAETLPAAVISYNRADYDNFLRIVEAEATGGDMKSKILVANVVINRVKSAAFPNTLTEVIFQGNGHQFQPVMDGRFYSVTVSQTTVEAVERALAGEDYSQGATFFASLYAAGPGSWHAENLIKLFEYGGHAFFRL